MKQEIRYNAFLSDDSTNESQRDESTFRDITSNFFSKMGPTKQVDPIPINKSSNEFLLRSSEVRTRLKKANSRMKEFQQLASKTGLFNDHDSKLNSLLQNIKGDIDWTHATVEQLYASVRNELQKSIIELLQTQAIQISNVFKKVLQQHTERVKSQEEKRTKLEGNRDRLVRRSQASQPMFRGTPEQQPLTHQVLQVQESRVNQSKVTQMKKIETMLNDVAQVFQRLGDDDRSVEFFQEIGRIDKYTEESTFNVQKGRKELQTAYKRASENRGLILKVFLILFVFSFVYIVFVV